MMHALRTLAGVFAALVIWSVALIVAWSGCIAAANRHDMAVAGLPVLFALVFVVLGVHVVRESSRA